MQFKNTHPAGPIVWAGIVAVIFFLYTYGYKRSTVLAMPDAGSFGNVRNSSWFAEHMLAGTSDEPPSYPIQTNAYRAATEPFPSQPVILQDHRVIPWYEFLNHMFHSQSSAYLERKARP